MANHHGWNKTEKGMTAMTGGGKVFSTKRTYPRLKKGLTTAAFVVK